MEEHSYEMPLLRIFREQSGGFPEGASIRRRRECLSCHKRFTTYEMMESLPLVVVKKDGSRQSFDRNKVMSGLIRACEKRPVSINTLEEIVTEIEQVLQNEMEREVSSAEIGWSG